MKTELSRTISKKVITYEILIIACMIALIWLDEIIDIPCLLLGADPTPLNWRESVFESGIIAMIGIVITYYTKLFRRLKYLEGILPLCASCKKIRDDKGHWRQIESFIQDRSDAEFSHSICPECAKALYQDIKAYKNE